MLRDFFVGIKICTQILIDLQLGHFQKYKNFQTKSCAELEIGNLVIPYVLIMLSPVNPYT